MAEGKIVRINGSLVVARDLERPKIGDVVEVGDLRLIGEIVRLSGNKTSIQCYESTSGLRPGEPVVSLDLPLMAELGPGLIGAIYDGLQRYEVEMWKKAGAFMVRGLKSPSLDPDRRWDFTPRVKKGQRVVEGDVIGVVPESIAIQHKILVPVGTRGTIEDINEGKFTVGEPVATVKTDGGAKKTLTLAQKWPVRIPRPYKDRVTLVEPLITGQRVIDSFFPVAKGGTAAIPGGFGTGKTVMLHQLAKWSDADVIIYVGCGERGNEMADVVTHFPELEDPRTGRKLIERTVMIANVSNMPVSARETSIFMGITIGEYFRDQGYDVALMADSTSRWAEALRDISGRLEEIPAERGYPAYLAESIAEFYERAGRVVTLGGEYRVGSVTVMGAVSPPGGDFSEPVTTHTLRFIGTLWALDTDLAFRRHFPAIHWLKSYSRYLDLTSLWWTKYDEEWDALRAKAMELLEEASKVEETARIIGEKALPDEQRLVMLISEMIREGFLMQNALHEIDTYCEAGKQARLMRAIVEFYDLAEPLIREGVPIDKIRALSSVPELMRAKEEKAVEKIDELRKKARQQIRELAAAYGIGD
ncbi:MAG: V-type ATP synthase subunit A [Candidatus Bathyarchaeia archaeon]